MVDVANLQFGEIDARNEVFQQARQNSRVFFNSFQVPPGVSLDSLEGGARFFVLGQKGTGKTALIWYLKDRVENKGGKAEVVLFKSNLTDGERQRIATLSDTSIFSDQGKISIQYDYKQNWLWFIIRSLVRMIEEKDVVIGRDILHDLRELTGANKEHRQTIFSGLQFTKINASIESGLKIGVFKSSLKADIDAVFAPKSPDILEVIAVCERAIGQIKLASNARCSLFFDELELFLNKEDQRDRDLFLIRDLLYAVSRINRGLGHGAPSFVVYASVRSEVLQEVNRIGPETRKDVTDFGVNVAWDSKFTGGHQPILDIVAAKINASEIECGSPESEDVWNSYFPKRIFGKDTQQYLLDISMFKPRNLVRRLTLAQNINNNRGSFLIDDFSMSVLDFSADVWTEMEEELLSTYAPRQVSAIKAIFSGFKSTFKLNELNNRIEDLSRANSDVSEVISRSVSSTKIASDMYRIGALGNIFSVDVESREFQKKKREKSFQRQRWVFRGYYEPLLDEKFVVHESLWKAFQM